jgi:hypothetical protein
MLNPRKTQQKATANPYKTRDRAIERAMDNTTNYSVFFLEPILQNSIMPLRTGLLVMIKYLAGGRPKPP